MKIKGINTQTNEFVEKLLALESGISSECLIGRHSTCDLVLNSPAVSRVHGRILWQNGEYFFTDLGSTDGSQINETEVQINKKYILKPNDMLRIGEFVLTINFNKNSLNYQSQNNQIYLADSSKIRSLNQGEITVRCVEVIDQTIDVKTFRFVADPPVLFSYQPGQFVTLNLPIDERQVMRCYSISSAPSRPHTLDITVKRVPPPIDTPNAPPGLVSNWLHDNITMGSQIKLSGIMGKFTCVDRHSQKLLFISAGSGITPMMSMSRWLCDMGNSVDIVFVHSARTPRDIIFRQELELMAAQHPNFKLAVTTTSREPGQAWLGYIGRFNESMLKAIAPDFCDRTVYVCGPNPFMEGVKTILKGLDFPMDNYYEESFGSSPPSNKLAKPNVKAKTDSMATVPSVRVSLDSITRKLPPSSPIPETVTHRHSPSTSIVLPTTSSPSSISSNPIINFTKSAKEVICDGEEFILDVALQEGVKLPSGCRMGVCGACKQKLLEGKVHYDENPECEEGYILTCIAKPIGRVTIEA